MSDGSEDKENDSNEIEALKEENEELKKIVISQKKELSNFKHRIEKKIDNAKTESVKDLIMDLYKVRDNIQRAIEQDEQADVRNGIKKSRNKLDKILEDNGVKVIEPDKGVEVDPDRHEVIKTVESDEYDSSEIVEVYSVGYEYEGTILKPAKVISVLNE